MPEGIGYELEEIPGEREDRTDNPLRKFFSDPTNIATALIFGASLTQPRERGMDPLATFAKRAAGAASFRGGLQHGIQQRKIERQQTRFEQEQDKKLLALQERGVGLQERGVGLQEQQLDQSQEQFEAQMAFNEEQAALDRSLQAELTRISRSPTASEADILRLVPDMAGAYLDSFAYNEQFAGLSPQEQSRLATQMALESIMVSRSLLASGGEIVVQGGIPYVNVPGEEPAATPAAPDATSSATPQAQPQPEPSPPQQESPFAPSPLESAAQSVADFVRSGKEGAQEANASATQIERERVAGVAAPRLKRAFELGAKPRRGDVQIVAQLPYEKQRELGFSDEQIAEIARLARML